MGCCCGAAAARRAFCSLPGFKQVMIEEATGLVRRPATSGAATGSARSRRRLRALGRALRQPPHPSRAATQEATGHPTVSAELQELLGGFAGRASLFARHLGTGETFSILPDAVMPTASLIKVPLLALALHRIERGELQYNQPVAFSEAACLGQSNELWEGGAPREWEPYDAGDDIFARLR